MFVDGRVFEKGFLVVVVGCESLFSDRIKRRVASFELLWYYVHLK
jgi:hypothetical protein